jgi:hypothetical protein
MRKPETSGLTPLTHHHYPPNLKASKVHAISETCPLLLPTLDRSSQQKEQTNGKNLEMEMEMGMGMGMGMGME